jgi:translation elongation factor EF-Tu-like GTPase
MELLAKVTDVFTITGRGVVAMFEFVSPTGKVKVGDRVRFHNPDGRVVEATVRGVEIACGPKVHCSTGLLLNSEISKNDVDKGAQIWLFPREQTVKTGSNSD